MPVSPAASPHGPVTSALTADTTISGQTAAIMAAGSFPWVSARWLWAGSVT